MGNNHTAVYNLSVDGSFRVRFGASMAAYVEVVFTEDPQTPNHAERVIQAAKVLNRPQQYADTYALAAAASFKGHMPTDEQLDVLVALYWDLLALAPQVA